MKSTWFAAPALILGAMALAFPAQSDAPKPPPSKPVYVAHKPACEDMELSIYFPAYDSMLSSFSARTISAASDSLDGCAVTDIKVDVVSEEALTDETMAHLSEQRAAAVIEALADRGISAQRVKTNYVKINAAAAGAKVMTEPMARRVDLKLDVKPGYGL